MLAQPLQHCPVGVPVAVLAPDADDGDPRAKGGQPRLTRAAAGPVVPDLEHFDRRDPVHHQRFSYPTDIPGKQHVECPVCQLEHHRVFILIELAGRPLTSGMEHGKAH